MKIRNSHQKNWFIIDNESKGNYSHENPIKFLTSSLESSLCNYSDAYILVTGNITVTGGNNNTKVAFKNCAPFEKFGTEINETFVDNADFINITMPMYDLIEYSDNYSDTSGSLQNFKRDEIEANLIGNTENNAIKNGVKIAIPLKYFGNFWRSLEMSFINCKDELSLKWHENCILSSACTAATFTITNTKLYVLIVTLKTEDNTKLSKLLNEGFKRSIYWNRYKIIFKNYNDEYIRERLDASFQRVNRLFVVPCASGKIILMKIHIESIFFQDLR